MLFPSVAGLLVPLLSWLYHDHKPAEPGLLKFELRHYHAVSADARVAFHDARPFNSLATNPSESPEYTLRSKPVKIRRPTSPSALAEARRRSIRFAQSTSLDWDEDEIPGPDVESRETLLELAKITNNAYLEPGEPGWYDLGEDWNVVRTTP